jgi:hypothetical protein
MARLRTTRLSSSRRSMMHPSAMRVRASSAILVTISSGFSEEARISPARARNRCSLSERFRVSSARLRCRAATASEDRAAATVVTATMVRVRGRSRTPSAEAATWMASPRSGGAAIVASPSERRRVPPGPGEVASFMNPTRGRRKSSPVEARSSEAAVGIGTPLTRGPPIW